MPSEPLVALRPELRELHPDIVPTVTQHILKYYDPEADRTRGRRDERAYLLIALGHFSYDRLLTREEECLASRLAHRHLRQHGGRFDDQHILVRLADKHTRRSDP